MRRMGHSKIDIKCLGPGERLSLIAEFWNSLKPDDVPVTDAQRAELDRRLDDLEGDRDLGIPWTMSFGRSESGQGEPHCPADRDCQSAPDRGGFAASRRSWSPVRSR